MKRTVVKGFNYFWDSLKMRPRRGTTAPTPEQDKIGVSMSKQIRLTHPIYLDIPMLVSFAAAIEGGLSFGAEVTREESNSKEAAAGGSAKLGLSGLFNQFLNASAEVEVAGVHGANERSVEKSSRSHTEASIAIMLYDRLRRDRGYIVDPETLEDVKTVEPGALVEIAGTVEKNAIDAMVDYIDAVDILGNLATDEQMASADATFRKHRSTGGGKQKQETQSPLGKMRATLDKDRKRTPISNVLLRCTVPKDITAVVTLRTENLRDLTLSELHKNSVRVLGKVTRVIGSEESMSPFENYGMALLTPSTLNTAFGELLDNQTLAIEFSEVQVQGPALQVLPLMVFV